MMRHSRRTSRLQVSLFIIVLIACAVAALFYLAEYSAVAVVADVRWVSLLSAAMALMAAMIAVFAVRGRGWRTVFLAALLFAAFLVTLGVHRIAFHHSELEVRFRNDDVMLAGTFFLPKGPGPFPGIVYVHGSGPMTRAEFSMFGRWFADKGVASLAYDKRGAGESTGTRASATYSALASDVKAAMDYLRSRGEIDPGRVGMIAISEGEWVAPLAAVNSSEPAFLIIQSASGVTPAQQVQYEIEARLRSKGYSEEDIQKAAVLNSRVFDFVRTGGGGEELQAEIDRSKMMPWFHDAGKIPAELGSPKEWSWWKTVMDFDAKPYLRQVQCPVLVVIGADNPQYSAELAGNHLRGALEEGGNPDFEIRIFPGADHAMLAWPMPGRLPPPQFAKGYLAYITDWVLQRTTAKSDGEGEAGR